MIADDKTGKKGRISMATRRSSDSSWDSDECGARSGVRKLRAMQVLTDPHSPGKYRVNGVVQNMPEFQKAWGCKAGQPMVAENACHVW